MRRGRRKGIRHYGKRHDAPAWTGPVVRLEDLTDEERIAIGGRARGDRVPGPHHTWRCPACRHWTMNEAYRTGRCNFCLADRPAA